MLTSFHFAKVGKAQRDHIFLRHMSRKYEICDANLSLSLSCRVLSLASVKLKFIGNPEKKLNEIQTGQKQRKQVDTHKLQQIKDIIAVMKLLKHILKYD